MHARHALSCSAWCQYKDALEKRPSLKPEVKLEVLGAMNQLDATFAALVEDHERQGILSLGDVERLIEKRGLTPEQSIELYHRLKEGGIRVDQTDPDEPDAEELDSIRVDPESTVLRATPLLTHAEEIELGRRIALSKRAAESAVAPGSVSREVRDIIERGRLAKDRLVTSNIRLVLSIAQKYRAFGGIDFSDMVQEGVIGLMTAADRYDHRLGFKFSTYATWWIRQAITRALADKGRLVRYPVHVVESINRVQRAIRVYRRRNGGREPSSVEVAHDLNLKTEKVEFLRQLASLATVSLDEPIGDDTDEVRGDYIASNFPTPLAIAEEAQFSEAIESMLSTLSAREKDVIKKRFGFDGEEELTLEEVGKIYDLTRERIRQIQVKAMKKLTFRLEHLVQLLE
jgi:RNA polymerase primary sigma factor